MGVSGETNSAFRSPNKLLLMAKISISYRRSDSSAIAGRILDHLRAHYGAETVFMDIEDIPFGTNFRTHIHDTLVRSDVLIALIGANWLGSDSDGRVRMHEKTDPVRIEITTALENTVPIIPVLLDGAKMPSYSELPSEFGDFVFLNAAEVTSGREFRNQLDRLIGAIDRTLSRVVSTELHPGMPDKADTTVAAAKRFRQKLWQVDVVRYFLVPLILLLVAHHLVVNAFNLNTEYLWLASIVVSFVSGLAFFWFAGRGGQTATAFALALGLIGTAGMTISQSLNSGDSILPQTRFEWRDNVNFALVIALSFLAGNAFARLLRAMLSLTHSKQ